MELTPGQLRSESHGEIGRILQRDAGILIQRWSRRAIAEQPDAARVHHDTLLNHLPAFLDALGRSLAATNGDEWTHARPAAEHGDQRWQVGWSLAEVVRDYQLLRLVIFDYLEETLERSLSHREVMAVGVTLDDAILAGVSGYVASRDEHFHQLEQQRAAEARTAQEALQQREQSLRQADQHKNEFLATLAHEIRNLLSPLSNAVGILQLHDIADTTLVQVRDIAAKQVRLMTRLLDDLLDVTRIAQGKIELRKERVALANVAAQAAEVSGPLLRARKHQLDIASPAEPIWLLADRARLLQIIVNLLNNAAKYTNPGGGIRLALECADEEAVVRVSDNGIGIAPAMLPHIFDLFTQAELSPERTQGGLGIGLTLVKRLVELHGGSINAQSAGPGRGSEFTVRLPMAPADCPNNPGEPDGGLKLAGRHILIVEDNADGRESLAVLLRLLGHRVDVAENGTRGIEQGLAGRPEFALIDLDLPDVDGYQVAERLRAGLGQGIVLAALTGSSQPEDRRRSQEVGFDAHLTKPVEMQELQHLLKRKD